MNQVKDYGPILGILVLLLMQFINGGSESEIEARINLREMRSEMAVVAQQQKMMSDNISMMATFFQEMRNDQRSMGESVLIMVRVMEEMKEELNHDTKLLQALCENVADADPAKVARCG